MAEKSERKPAGRTESDIDISGELAKAEKEQSVESLAEAKDKAQFTATTAMSMVHITLLKQVLDSGPTMPYYTVSLVLICIAIILQIIIGVVAMIITNTKKFYSTFRDNVFEDVFANCFRCKVTSRESLRRQQRIQLLAGDKSLDLSQWDLLLEDRGMKKDMDLQDFDPEEAGCLPCKFPWLCTRRVHPVYEYDILDRYDVYCEMNVRAEIAAARSRQELRLLQTNTTTAKEGLLKFETELQQPGADKETVTAQLEVVKGKLQEYENKRREIEGEVLKGQVLSDQGKVLSGYADIIRKRRVLKMISFWQSFINYLLYIVFIANAFIAGFGIAGSESLFPAAQNNTRPASSP